MLRTRSNLAQKNRESHLNGLLWWSMCITALNIPWWPVSLLVRLGELRVCELTASLFFWFCSIPPANSFFMVAMVSRSALVPFKP